MSRSLQIHLPPMEVRKLSVPTESHGNSLAVDFCELVVTAFTRCGYSQQNAAACLEMKPAAFSKAFDSEGKYPDQNPVMKRLGRIPTEVIREFFALGSSKLGLAHGIDQEKVQASIALAAAIRNVLREGSR